MARDGNQIFRRAILVLHHRVANTGFVGEIFSGIYKESGDGFFAFQGFHKRFQWLRKDGLLRALGDHLIGVPGQHGKNFRAIRRREMRSARANCDLTLAGSAACAKVIENFRAEGFHGMLASNLSGQALLYRRLREFQRAAWLARSIPATPRRNRPRSLQTAGWRKSAAFLRREVLHQATACRPPGCARGWPRKWKRQGRGEQRRKKLRRRKMDEQQRSASQFQLRPAFALARARRKKTASRHDARQCAASHKFRPR